MTVTTPSTIMPPPTCDAFILAPKLISGKSLVKFRKQIPRIEDIVLTMFFSGLTDARTHEHWKHNAFGHYVGGGIKTPECIMLLSFFLFCLKCSYNQLAIVT